jgi:hypothetical protein
MTREEALKALEGRDGRYPLTYLGVPLMVILNRIGMSHAEFDSVCKRFYNKKAHAC